ncbi:hypothetical protein D9619_007458 [Psilocybe cf. subviscida]|uniref:Myb/SANT-like domain-containing protein n=1 Tax=Psilocybe cf. subviscida TaxID=2480587 RepID=A0A8H5EWK6_9AGAR|nr:hypothetical protein D9619_007458 [Psilocybe cf. subviscida]
MDTAAMAQKAQKAHWTPKEEQALLEFLVEHKSEARDGGNFKQATFCQAALHLAPLHVCSAQKAGKNCANKYSYFRQLYRIVVAIQAASGWVWDDKTSGSINPDTLSSWDDYVQAHPDARPFRNRGWPYLGQMEDLMPSTVQGANVYHATAASPLQPAEDPANSDHESVGNELSDDEEPTSLALGTKRQCAPSTPPRPHAKWVRPSGSSALASIADSISAFTSTFANTLAPPTQPGIAASPVCRQQAVAAVQSHEKGWLTVTQRIKLIELLKKDQDAVDVYLALTEEDVHHEWLFVYSAFSPS